MACSIALTFIGDKIWNEDEYLRELHHRDHHLFHRKNRIIYRKESNLSNVSNENDYYNDHDHIENNEAPVEKEIPDIKNVAVHVADFKI